MKKTIAALILTCMACTSEVEITPTSDCANYCFDIDNRTDCGYTSDTGEEVPCQCEIITNT